MKLKRMIRGPRGIEGVMEQMTAHPRSFFSDISQLDTFIHSLPNHQQSALQGSSQLNQVRSMFQQMNTLNPILAATTAATSSSTAAPTIAATSSSTVPLTTVTSTDTRTRKQKQNARKRAKQKQKKLHKTPSS
jgi:hypothetical protein